MLVRDAREGTTTQVGPPSNAQGGPGAGSPSPGWERALGAALEAKADDLAAAMPVSFDAVEATLADALQRAAAAKQWRAVETLAAELRARREARAGVVDLDAERLKRGRPKT